MVKTVANLKNVLGVNLISFVRNAVRRYNNIAEYGIEERILECINSIGTNLGPDAGYRYQYCIWPLRNQKEIINNYRVNNIFQFYPRNTSVKGYSIKNVDSSPTIDSIYSCSYSKK